MEDILLKILAVLCWIAVAVIYLIIFPFISDKGRKDIDLKSSFSYYCNKHNGLLMLVIVLVGIELFQLGYMFWNNTIPYIIDDYEGELISTHWTSSIQYKCAFLLIIGAIYYIVKFFQREKDFRHFQYKEKEQKELRDKSKELEDKFYRNLVYLEDNLPKIVSKLEKDTFIYIKYIEYHDGKIYKLDTSGGLPISGRDEERPWRDWISIDDIARALHYGDAYIYDITKEDINLK